jgi:hypothetical protein
MYKNIHLEQHQVDHYLSDQPVTHYNTSLWRITTAHGKRIPRMHFRRSCVAKLGLCPTQQLEWTSGANLGIDFRDDLQVHVSLLGLQYGIYPSCVWARRWSWFAPWWNEVLQGFCFYLGKMRGYANHCSISKRSLYYVTFQWEWTFSTLLWKWCYIYSYWGWLTWEPMV